MTSSSVGDGRVGQEVCGRIDRRGVDAEVPEQGRCGDVEARCEVEALGTRLSRETGCDDGPVALEGGQGRLAWVDGLPQRDHDGLTETCGELVDARSTRCELGRRLDRQRDELRVSRSTGVDPDLPVGEVGGLGGHPFVLPLLFCCRDDDDRRCDAEGEGDRGECSPGTGLVAGEISQRQAWSDGDVTGGPGEDADCQRTEEQGAEDRRQKPGHDQGLAGSVGEREAAHSSRDQQGGQQSPNDVRASASGVAQRGRG